MAYEYVTTTVLILDTIMFPWKLVCASYSMSSLLFIDDTESHVIRMNNATKRVCLAHCSTQALAMHATITLE
jgi:hypothetical protein